MYDIVFSIALSVIKGNNTLLQMIVMPECNE